MKIGYPCSNLSVGCSTGRTFRLASYSPERLVDAVQANLDCLQRTLDWNLNHDIRFFRISSSTVPFASHPVQTFDWQHHFADQFAKIGRFVRTHGMRINVHPGQYTLLNSPKQDVFERSVAELLYHAEMLDLMELDDTNKIQVHTGGIYGDKAAATETFVARYRELPDAIRRRLVIENDERQYSLADNLVIHRATGIPVLFDVFHHSILNEGETLDDAFDAFIPTWQGHGAPMMDYSSQHTEKQAGAHTQSIDLDDFARVMAQLDDRRVDLMLEIKDKEGSVLKAMEWLHQSGVAPATLSSRDIESGVP